MFLLSRYVASDTAFPQPSNITWHGFIEHTEPLHKTLDALPGLRLWCGAYVCGSLNNTFAGPITSHQLLSEQLLVECCFTSTETVGLLGTGAQDVHLTFTQLLSSGAQVNMVLNVHRNHMVY